MLSIKSDSGGNKLRYILLFAPKHVLWVWNRIGMVIACFLEKNNVLTFSIGTPYLLAVVVLKFEIVHFTTF